MSLTKEQKQRTIESFAQHAGDTGSTEVQVAVLTERINDLTEHLKRNHKDYSSKRGLLQMVANRRTFLKYLQRKDKDSYEKVVERLGLKK